MLAFLVMIHTINRKPGDDFEYVPGSEFTVSRTAHKDNSSFYCINDKRVQFKEVSKLLQSHGIDLRYNRFLILQGEVEQIALMKPKADNDSESGMLEFLEDIIGTTRLKEPLNKLSLKVEEYNEIRAEKMNRVRVVEKEMKSLEEAKNEAVRFLETENQITIEKSKLYQIHKSEAIAEAENCKGDYDRAKDIYEKAMSEVNDIKKKREETEEEQKQMGKEFAVINKKAEEFQEKYKDCERRDVQLRDKIKNIKAKGKKLEKTIEEETKKSEELTQMPDKCLKDIEGFTVKKEKVETDLKEAEERLAVVMGEIKGDIEPLRNQKDMIERQLLEVQKGVNESRSQMEIAKHELSIYLSEEQNQKSRLQQLKYKLEKNISDAKDKRSALQKFQTEIPSAEQKLKEMIEEIEKLETKKNKCVDEFRNKSQHLNELKHSAVDKTSKNRILNALMEQKRKGHLKGILGRLGDLGAVDRKYDIAVSTACGPLDNIVTETLNDATECINFLKKNNLGTAKFIALDKMSQRYRWTEGDAYPEGVPRLFDLIRVKDERVRVAFYYGLHDTLVTDDIEQGSRIAYDRNKTQGRRYRVVTLKGQLFETSGTMSGGGRPSSGRIGSSVAVSDVDESEITALEEEVNLLSHKINELNNRLEDLRSESERLTKDIAVMKQNKPQFEMEVKQFDKMETELNKDIKQQEERVRKAAPDSNQVKQLTEKVEKETKKFEKEEQKCNRFNEQISELEEKINEVMDSKVGSVRRKNDELKNQLKKVNTDLNKANVALTTCQRNIEKTKEKIHSLEEEREQTLKSLTDTKDDIKRLEEEAKEVSVSYEAATNEKEEAEEKLKTIQTRISKLKAQELKINNENVDAKHELEEQKKKLDAKEAEVNRFVQHLAALELHKILGKEDMIFPELTAEEMENLTVNSLQKEIENLEKDLKKMKPNMAAIEEFRKKENLFLERHKEMKEVTEQRDAYKNQFEEIRELRLKEFKDGFITIARKLKEMYRMITMGGDAELEFIDSLDPFQEGVTFAVRPNKKSWKKISNLSGGEKTLSSLALIFALHYYKPSPLYVMDEIDAALDFKNVSIVANYIKQRTRNTQFIIISLRNNMYELADRLVGIYKTYNCTKSVTVNPQAIEDKRMDRRTVALSSTQSHNNESPSKTCGANERTAGDTTDFTDNTTVNIAAKPSNAESSLTSNDSVFVSS